MLFSDDLIDAIWTATKLASLGSASLITLYWVALDWASRMI